ncbi:MAG: sulfite exporter TauE/SafE family protein [Proteobacteria bacterium]|nr:sulfite exporter TauE/SafE family protein [Pseudomonadota bacterium]
MEGNKLTLMIFAGLAIGVLSSLSGLGGGFIAVPLLLYMGRSTQGAVGTSFLFVFLVALSSLAAHYRLGNVDIKSGLLLGIGGIIGAQIGPLILQQVSDQNFKRIFGCFLVGMGIWMVIGTRANT